MVTAPGEVWHRGVAGLGTCTELRRQTGASVPGPELRQAPGRAGAPEGDRSICPRTYTGQGEWGSLSYARKSSVSSGKRPGET